MAKAIFTSKVDSGYDDDIEIRYHFPRKYLRSVQETVGDLIIYYQPRRGGNQTYFGVAKVVGIRPDPNRSDHYYADLSDYLSFEREVPYLENGIYYESQLQKPDGSANKGTFGWSVRLIPYVEFQNILAAGFALAVDWPDDASRPLEREFAETEQSMFDTERPTISLTRPFRDRAFAKIIQNIYDRRCAVTGLRILNGGGRPEVQAAHIKPISAAGPDSIRNGIALSGTIHWLFDRGLMTFEDDLRIRVARDSVPSGIRALINPSGHLIVPNDEAFRPSPRFLRFHRESIFKG